MVLDISSLYFVETWISIYHPLYLLNQPALPLYLYELTVIYEFQWIIFGQRIVVAIITVCKYPKSGLFGWFYGHVRKVLYKFITGVLRPFTDRKRCEEIRPSFYACMNPCIAFFRFISAIGVNFLLLFFTNVQNSSHS